MDGFLKKVAIPRNIHEALEIILYLYYNFIALLVLLALKTILDHVLN